MIESKIKTEDNKVWEFPKLMIYAQDLYFIVMFEQPSIGTVVYSETKQWYIGEQFSDWVMDKFTDYNKEVVLKNI